MPRYRLSGDEGVGLFEPEDVREPSFTRLAPKTLDRLRACAGLAGTVADVLDELGWLTSVSGDVLRPRHHSGAPAVGHVQTLVYMPARRHLLHPGHEELPPRLAHHVVYRLAQPGDVVVVDALTPEPISVLGGIAANTAVTLGLSGVVVDGSVRDVDQIRATGLPLWSRWVTPRSGKGRMEAVAVNAPARCGGVQVRPGDLAVADETGLCFVPLEIADEVIERVFEVTDAETAQTARR